MVKFLVCIFFICSGITIAQNENFIIDNLSINNENPHFGLMRVNDDILFASYELDKKGRVKRVHGQPKLTIFQGVITNSGTIDKVSQLQIDSKAGVPQISSATLSQDGNKIYITTVYTNKNKPKVRFKETNFHLEVGEFKAGIGFTNFKVLSFCKPKFSYAHPALSADGKTLFFTANIKGGKATTRGGSDIFKVDILGGNSFSEPENLGAKVNSYGKEMFPFIAEDNTLYFSSNRPNGFGGYDLYKSTMNDDGAFEKAEKLEKPLNSNKDDLSLIMNRDNTSGFLSSKRLKGKGDDDIYSFKKK
ncbi:TolB family protein [Algibacter sp. L1A34]|uniref:TolB family protein n=1 Tax=Algibacter sp. L1A34 TaxID=2686365 RepID=UPI00131CAE63|nr:PD40 domain-containing protein [Algibacter sp. L1A34]